MNDPAFNTLKAAQRAAEMTSWCTIDYDWRAPEDSRYSAVMWCNDVGQRISAYGPDIWTAVQAVHALAEIYKRDPSLFKG